jgi:CSLREA domain-containing protein
VNSAADTSDGVCDVSNCTLREAMLVANSGDSIVFSSLFDARQTISLTAALPNIAKNLTITGPSSSRLNVRRSTGGNYRIFTITAGVTANLSGLNISGGNSDYGGRSTMPAILPSASASSTVMSPRTTAADRKPRHIDGRANHDHGQCCWWGRIACQAPGTAARNCTIASNVAGRTARIANVNSGAPRRQ